MALLVNARKRAAAHARNAGRLRLRQQKILFHSREKHKRTPKKTARTVAWKMDKILEEASESIGNAAERDAEDEIDGFYDCVSENPEGKEQESAAVERAEAETPEQYKDLDEALQFKEEGNRCVGVV